MAMIKYSCSRCGRALPHEDVHQERNVALCCACRKAVRPLAGVLPENIEAGNRFVTVERHSMGGMRVTYRKKDWIALPCLLFGAVWIFCIVHLLLDWGLLIISCYWFFQMLGMAFFVLFLWAGVSTVVHAVVLLLGKTVVELDRGRGRVFRGIGAVGWSWRFSMPAPGGVHLAVRRERGHDAEWRPEWLIAVPQAGGRTFWFGQGIGDVDAACVICALLNQQA